MDNFFDNIDNPEEVNESFDNLPAEENSSEDYQFASGTLDNFISDFEEEKEDMGIDMEPTPEEFAETGKPSISGKTARKTAKFISYMTDKAASNGLALISGLDPSEHRADEEILKELEDIYAEYLKENGYNIPRWLQLTLTLGVAYGLQVPNAIRLRKLNKKRTK